MHIKAENTFGLAVLLLKNKCNRDAKYIEIINNALQNREIPTGLTLLENVFTWIEARCKEIIHEYSHLASIVYLTV